MRQKILVGILSVTVGFLVITNPVMAEAAKQITGKQIKNGTITSADLKNNNVKSKDIKNNQIKSKDVKNGSLTAADLAPGTLPNVQVQAFQRFFTPFDLFPIPTSQTMLGSPTTITVDGSEAVAVTGTLVITSTNAGDDVAASVCFVPTGSSDEPSVLGGSEAEHFSLDVTTNEEAIPVASSDIIAAGTYDVGICARTSSGNTGTIYHVQNGGFVQVMDGTGPLLPPAPKLARRAPSSADVN